MTEFAELTLDELRRLPWLIEAHQLGVSIHWLGEYSEPMCPIHGWVDVRKFGRYRWGCAYDQLWKRRWSKCHWRFECSIVHPGEAARKEVKT